VVRNMKARTGPLGGVQGSATRHRDLALQKQDTYCMFPSDSEDEDESEEEGGQGETGEHAPSGASPRSRRSPDEQQHKECVSQIEASQSTHVVQGSNTGPNSPLPPDGRWRQGRSDELLPRGLPEIKQQNIHTSSTSVALGVCNGNTSSADACLLSQVVGGVLQSNEARETQLNVRVGCIYKITSPSGKAYVGQTVNFVNRKSRHKLSKNKQGSCRAISAAIELYGWDAMHVEILLEGVEENDLDCMEQRMIAEHGTYHADSPGGYNLTRGGDKNPVKDPLVAARMQEMYKSNEWKEKQLGGFTEVVRKKISVAQHDRQARGGFEQVRAASKLGLPLAHERKNSPAAKAKRAATWAAKREAKLAKMDPKKAASLRRKCEYDAAWHANNGPPPGYKEYQAEYRAKKKAERDEKRLTPGNCATPNNV
jgi:group I intron endonuclease